MQETSNFSMRLIMKMILPIAYIGIALTLSQGDVLTLDRLTLQQYNPLKPELVN
jgi:hypothetical protein